MRFSSATWSCESVCLLVCPITVEVGKVVVISIRYFTCPSLPIIIHWRKRAYICPKPSSSQATVSFGIQVKLKMNKCVYSLGINFCGCWCLWNILVSCNLVSSASVVDTRKHPKMRINRRKMLKMDILLLIFFTLLESGTLMAVSSHWSLEDKITWLSTIG